jgi:ABC-type Fe3+-siderophore transport system permease subunit
LVLLFVVFFIAVAAQVGPIPEALRPVVKLLLLAGVLESATTMVAMEYSLFSFDNSSARKKVFWFCGDTVPSTRTRSLVFHCLLAL